MSAYYMANKDRIIEYQKEYYAKNREKIRQYYRLYYKLNRQRIKELRYNYYLRNRLYYLKYCKDYRMKKHKEKINQLAFTVKYQPIIITRHPIIVYFD